MGKVQEAIALYRGAKPTNEIRTRLQVLESVDKYQDVKVNFSGLAGYKKLQRNLNGLGFKAGLWLGDGESLPNDNTEDGTFGEGADGSLLTLKAHEAIWIGCNLGPEVVFATIVVSVRHWPHLKYIDSTCNGQMDDYVYVGGATSTAIEDELVPWTNFKDLSPAMSKEQFHETLKKHNNFK